MVNFIEDNIFNAPKDQIICHQVNCKGKMGKGIAGTIAKLFPNIYDEYVTICETMNPLGRVWIVQDKEGDHHIANLFSQYGYGNDGRYTNYEALAQVLEKLSKRARELNMSLAFPYGMGCNNAGGNWNIVLTMITELCYDVDVYIYKLK